MTLLMACAAPLCLRADSPLEEQMDTMKGAFRALRTSLEAPAEADRGTYVALAEELRAAAVAAKEHEPQKTRSLPEDKRAAFLGDYRQSIDDLVTLIDELKTQLADGKWDEARAQIKLINQSQRDGHKEFRQEEN
ncbi:MAG: hypothetical protein JHD33_01875 [Chthoniobacterales bacterium]|jgi:soluble cytochrome b562|nr:hypothetical protein [Chthoniobacterales bacterium]